MKLKKNRVLAVIPARYHSRRYPGKLLEMIDGATILSRVIRKAGMVEEIDHLVLVGGDDEILSEAAKSGADFRKSEGDFRCGTDRCASILNDFADYDIIINIQADQPFLNPTNVDQLISAMKINPAINIASLMSAEPCTDPSPSIVKISVDENGMAKSFTRHLQEDDKTFQHIGVYGFRRGALERISKLVPTQNEVINDLEQLRWMDHGYDILMVPVHHTGLSINVPEDLTLANSRDTNTF